MSHHDNSCVSSARPQRTLVLQGAVALGAYEAGVIRSLCNEIAKEIKNDDENIFDIVCGASAGAINAAILVSYVIDRKKKRQQVSRKQRWLDAADHLIEFWKYISSKPDLYFWWPYISDEKRWMTAWDERHRLDKIMAEGEAARRYYSTKEFLYTGAPHVFSRSGVLHDNKFFDNLYPPVNIGYRYDNGPLRESIVEFTDFDNVEDFEIKTSPDKNEPRLLAVAVDVKESKAVTFDSYSLSSTYYDYNKQTKKYEVKNLNYPAGMALQHVMASSSVPIYYKFEEIEKRKFWDGGLLSNTPLREVIQGHTDYWIKMKSKKDVPDLDVYIVNVWPSHQDETPNDNDAMADRKNDITFADKTEYDIRASLYVTDYIDLIHDLTKFASNLIDRLEEAEQDQGGGKKNATRMNEDNLMKELNDLFDAKAKSTSRFDEKKKKTYRELVEGKVRLDKVVMIERKDGSVDHNISRKWMDYTKETINRLIDEGLNYNNTALIRKY